MSCEEKIMGLLTSILAISQQISEHMDNIESDIEQIKPATKQVRENTTATVEKLHNLVNGIY